MSMSRLTLMRTTVHWAVAALFAGLLAIGSSPALSSAAQAAPASLRLYVFDCGYLINLSPETYNLTRQDVPDPTMSVSCFLVVHPNGALIFDTGLGDRID